MFDSVYIKSTLHNQMNVSVKCGIISRPHISRSNGTMLAKNDGVITMNGSLECIIFVQNIRCFLWNRCAWHFFLNTNISGSMYSVHRSFMWFVCLNRRKINPDFVQSLLTMISKLKAVHLLWHHRYMIRSLAIVTSKWPLVPMWFLWMLS